MRRNRIPKFRLYMVGACLLLSWAALLIRLYQIQILEGERLEVFAESQGTRRQPLLAPRGTVYDRHGYPLAFSVSSSSSFEPKLSMIPESRNRQFPLNGLTGRIIGLVDYRGIGTEGVEARFDEILRGRDGRAVFPVVGNGSISPYEPAVIEERPKAGSSIVLTIDTVYQGLAQKEAHDLRESSAAQWAGILIMDPDTGEILAAATAPDFNPESPPSGGTSSHFLWSYSFEPGSSFKIVTFAAALESGSFTEDSQIDAENGEWYVFGRTWHDTHPMGVVPLSEIVAHSSNIGAVKLGSGVGKDFFFETARKLGFGQISSTDLHAEVSGSLRKPRRSVSLAAMSMGHEVMVTPVQLLNAYCCIGNSGRLIQPCLVRFVEGGDDFESIGIRQSVTPRNARILSRLLTGVVDHGTGKRAAHPLIPVAGKTGTAQKADPGGAGYRPGAYISTFAGFFPVDNPVVAILVIVDEPRNGTYGGEICAPAFRRVMDSLLSAPGGCLYPELASLLSQAPAAGSSVTDI